MGNLRLSHSKVIHVRHDMLRRVTFQEIKPGFIGLQIKVSAGSRVLQGAHGSSYLLGMVKKLGSKVAVSTKDSVTLKDASLC